MKTILSLLLTLTMTLPLIAQDKPASSAWDKLVDEFFDSYFQFNPSTGTSSGFHQYDTQLEDYSRAGVDKQVAWANEWLGRLGKFDGKSLSLEQRQDYEMVV